MENKLADGLQKRWFIEGLHPKLQKKMKIVPPSTYTEAYNRALNLESEQKKKKKKTSSSESNGDEPSGEDSSNDEGSSKKVRALQKDMIRMMKEFKNMNKETKSNDLWCTECKKESHTKGSCPKDHFCEICQIMGHSVKECPFNLKTRTPQQVFLTQETSPSGGSRNTRTKGVTSGGYRNNQSGQNNNNNNNNNNSGNNNNGGRSRIQYDANGQPIVQCCACNMFGHFARECTTANTLKLLCRWCGPSDHDNAKCSKSGVNLITVGMDEEEALAITQRQAKEYLDLTEEKRKFEEARVEIEKASHAETSQLKDTTDSLVRNSAEQNIIQKTLQMEVPVKLNDLLLTMPQLQSALTNIVPVQRPSGEKGRGKEIATSGEDQMLLALTSGRHPAVVEMGILGHVLTDTIVDEGSGVNVLPKETWKKLGQPTLWPPKFQLLTADQHDIKPLGILLAQPVMIGTQSFLLDFVVIPLKRKGYDAILGRGWFIQARVRHDWKKNTLSLESKGRRFVIDLHT